MRRYEWVQLLRGRLWHAIREDLGRVVETKCGIAEGINGQRFTKKLLAEQTKCPRCVAEINKESPVMIENEVSTKEVTS